MFPILILLKNNNKIGVCLKYNKLNGAFIAKPFPKPFTVSLLDEVGGKEMYTFLDGFNRYNQVKMALKDMKNLLSSISGVFL